MWDSESEQEPLLLSERDSVSLLKPSILVLSPSLLVVQLDLVSLLLPLYYYQRSPFLFVSSFMETWEEV